MLVVQTFSGIFFLTKLDARIILLEECPQDDKVAAVAIVQLPECMLRNEINLFTLANSVERIEKKIDMRDEEEKRRKK